MSCDLRRLHQSAMPIARASKARPLSAKEKNGKTALVRGDVLSVRGVVSELQGQLDKVMLRYRAEVDTCLQEWARHHDSFLQLAKHSPPSGPEPTSPKSPSQHGSQFQKPPLKQAQVLLPESVQSPKPPLKQAQVLLPESRHPSAIGDTPFLPDADVECHDLLSGDDITETPVATKSANNNSPVRHIVNSSQVKHRNKKDDVKDAGDISKLKPQRNHSGDARYPSYVPSGDANVKHSALRYGAQAAQAWQQADQKDSPSADLDDRGDIEMDKKESHAVFADVAAMKAKLKENLDDSKDAGNCDLLHETGIARAIATHPIFEYATLTLIGFNALWMGYDTDNNFAATLADARIEFVIAENIFCFYFFVEWLVRFLAFKHKASCYKDRWFVFDTALVLTMVVETWALTLVLVTTGMSVGSGRAIRWFRLLRLTRLARMARLLRAMPELLIMVKAIVISMKTVIYALILLLGMIYVFSIAFTQMMEGRSQPEGTAAYDFFRSVPHSMNTLLLQGALPDQASLIDTLQAESPIYYVLMLIYLFFASLTLMNMLIGILCDVISAVSEVEKESMLITGVKEELRAMMSALSVGSEEHAITREEFERLLAEPRAARVFQHLGVDVVGLVDFTDYIFATSSRLSFGDFMDIILQLRGSNTATVKDIIDLRKLMVKEMEEAVGKIQMLKK